MIKRSRQDTIEHLGKLLMSGKVTNSTDVQRELNVSRTESYRLMKDGGYSFKNPPPYEDIDNLLRLYYGGMKPSDIAVELDISERRIYSTLTKFGFDTRSIHSKRGIHHIKNTARSIGIDSVDTIQHLSIIADAICTTFVSFHDDVVCVVIANEGFRNRITLQSNFITHSLNVVKLLEDIIEFSKLDDKGAVIHSDIERVANIPLFPKDLTIVNGSLIYDDYELLSDVLYGDDDTFVVEVGSIINLFVKLVRTKYG